MDELCDGTVLRIVDTGGVPQCDRWVLTFVCRRFRRLFRESLAPPPVLKSQKRKLDVVLARAVEGGGLATVRMLSMLSMRSMRSKRSCVWATAGESAARRGDVEMVRFLISTSRISRKMPQQQLLLAALAGGHVAVADLLIAHDFHAVEQHSKDAFATGDGTMEIIRAAAKSASAAAALEWVERLVTPAVFRASLAELAQPSADLLFFWVRNNRAGLEFFLDRMPSSIQSSKTILRTTNADVLKLWMERRSSPLSSDDIHRVVGNIVAMPDHHDALAYIESSIRDVVESNLLAIDAVATWDYHGYLRRTGRAGSVVVDVTKALNDVLKWEELADPLDSSRRIELLTRDVLPDPNEWIARVPADVLKRASEKQSLQAIVVPFLKTSGEETTDFFDIRINYSMTLETATEHVATMLAYGGRCTVRTFVDACNSRRDDNVEMARMVMKTMSAEEKKGVVFYKGSRNDELCVRDYETLVFLDEEIGLTLERGNLLFFDRMSLTLEYAEFVVANERWGVSPRDVFNIGATFRHVDIVERFAPMCTKQVVRREMELILGSCRWERRTPDKDILDTLDACLYRDVHPWLMPTTRVLHRIHQSFWGMFGFD